MGFLKQDIGLYFILIRVALLIPTDVHKFQEFL